MDRHDLYMSAWKSGLKTTYYLRSKAATRLEKSTIDANDEGIISMSKACLITDPDCESCQ